MKPATLALAAALGGCAPCKPQPPPPTCKSDADCPPGDACLAGSCNPLTEVLANLAAVVQPPSRIALPGGAAEPLAPQEFRGVDATQPTAPPLTLAAPQILSGTLPVPTTCTPGEALPITLRFSGHPFIPLLDWTFEFQTDAAGQVHGALPANEQFDVWVATAAPCAAPIFGTDDTVPNAVDVGQRWPFLEAPDVLTVVGAVSAPGASQPLAGAAITVKGAQGSFAGTTLSATVASQAGPTGFVLPVPLAQVLAQPGIDGGSCAPPPASQGCTGEDCPPLPPCALLSLEVGPSDALPELPTVDVPIVGRLSLPPDGGGAAGPVLSLLGADGLGVRLPIGPGQSTLLSGRVLQPNGEPSEFCQVSVDGTVATNDGACAGGCRYRLSTSTLSDGGYALEVPAGGSYTLTATPPPGLGLAPVSLPVPSPSADGGVEGFDVVLRPGFQLTGQVFDSQGIQPVGGDTVEVLDLASGSAAALVTAGGDGRFGVTVPPGAYLVDVHPPDATGFPDRSEPVQVSSDTALTLTLFPGARLQGAVIAEPGGVPVPLAGVRLYYVEATQGFGTLALPIASGVTDAQGQFSVAVPASSARSP